MNYSDEELQEKIERGETPEGYPEFEIISYRHLFRSLTKEPDYPLPSDFADKILEKVEVKNKISESSDHFWLFLSIVGILIVFASAIWISGLEIHFTVMNDIMNFKGILFLGIMLFALIQIIDWKFIRPWFL